MTNKNKDSKKLGVFFVFLIFIIVYTNRLLIGDFNGSQEAIWPGSGSSGSTKIVVLHLLGYTIQTQNSKQRPTSKRNGVQRLIRYPIMDVELQDNQFYACLEEESISEYGPSQVNQFNIRDNLFHLKGQSTSSNFTHKRVKSTLSENIFISEEYGSEAMLVVQPSSKRTRVQYTLSSQTYNLNN